MRAIILTLFAAALLSACGPMPQLQHIDVQEVDKREMAEAFSINVYEGSTPHPKVTRYLESLDATACKNKLWDPPATKGNALQQLRLKAHRLGATALVNVHFDKQGTDAWGTNCWQSVTATGDAVVLAR